MPRHSAIRFRPGALALALALTGCNAGPDYRAPEVDAPADFSAAHGGAPELAALQQPQSAPEAADQWRVFSDPVLDELQRRALLSSPDLQSAALRLAQSRAQRAIAGSQRGPQLDFNAGVSRQNQSETGAGNRVINAIAPPGAERDALIKTVSQPFDLYQVGFDASWELDLWGRIRRTLEAGDANVAGARALLDDTRLSLSCELARAYFELRGTQQQQRLTRADIEAAGDSLDLIAARARAGLIDDLDLARQRAQLENLRALLPQLGAQEAATINRITLLVGARPGELNALLAAVDTAGNTPRWPDFSIGLPADIARRRPDIRAAEADLHAATANIGIASADLYPRVVLGASFGFESIDSGDLGDWRSRQWSIGPSLNLPLFDRGRRRATVTLRELEQQQAAVHFQQTVLKAWHEVDDALSAYNAGRLRYQHLLQQRDSSELAYTLAKARYEGGLTDFIVELDAFRGLLQARRDLAQSDSQLRTLMVALFKAVGGAVPLAPQQPVASAATGHSVEDGAGQQRASQ